jgi:ADP-heptose:LPS heptosyltransferase
MIAMMRAAKMTGADIARRCPQVRVAIIEIKKAKIGARYHCGVTVGEAVRYASAVTITV